MNLSMVSESNDDKNFENEDNENVEIFNERDWMAIAEVMPNALPANITLWNRDMNLLNNWNTAYYQYPGMKNDLSFFEKNRELIGDHCKHVQSSGIIFNEQQNKILNFLNTQLCTENNCTDKLAIIQGKARTGKSCMINEMVTRISSKFGVNCTLLMALTGVTANNINGQTIHSALRIPVKKPMK